LSAAAKKRALLSSYVRPVQGLGLEVERCDEGELEDGSGTERAPLVRVPGEDGELTVCTKGAGDARKKCQGPGRPRKLGDTVDLEEYLRCWALAAEGGPEVGREAWS